LDSYFKTLLDDLAAFGAAHDADPANHERRLLNIAPETGAFLAVLAKAAGARRILEIGTSNGYATLWLANAVADVGGAVTTIELAHAKIEMARANFARAGLDTRITLLEGDAGTMLARLFDVSFELLFLDAQRSAYPDWWPDIRRVLRPGGLLVVENADDAMDDFLAAVRADRAFTTTRVPVGNGVFLAVKA
jgi:predicted O-methyltransferase YrrM